MLRGDKPIFSALLERKDTIGSNALIMGFVGVCGTMGIAGVCGVLASCRTAFFFLRAGV